MEPTQDDGMGNYSMPIVEEPTTPLYVPYDGYPVWWFGGCDSDDALRDLDYSLIEIAKDLQDEHFVKCNLEYLVAKSTLPNTAAEPFRKKSRLEQREPGVWEHL